MSVELTMVDVLRSAPTPEEASTAHVMQDLNWHMMGELAMVSSIKLQLQPTPIPIPTPHLFTTNYFSMTY